MRKFKAGLQPSLPSPPTPSPKCSKALKYFLDSLYITANFVKIQNSKKI